MAKTIRMGRNFKICVLLGKFTFIHIHTCITNKLLIIDNNIQKQKCRKFNFKQLSHSMSVRNIDRYTRIQGKTASLATAKLAIFGTDILWKSCFKLNLEQLFHTMSIVNITILAVARKNMSIATNYKKSFFTKNNINLCKNNQNSLDIPKSPPGDPIFTGLRRCLTGSVDPHFVSRYQLQ